jgi:hypothetical protein
MQQQQEREQVLAQLMQQQQQQQQAVLHPGNLLPLQPAKGRQLLQQLVIKQVVLPLPSPQQWEAPVVWGRRALLLQLALGVRCVT